jgi:hypothetical protein
VALSDPTASLPTAAPWLCSPVPSISAFKAWKCRVQQMQCPLCLSRALNLNHPALIMSPPTLASSNTTMPNWNHLNRESRKMPSLTREIIQAAIDGFEAQKQRLDAQIAELRAMLTGSQAPSAKEPKAGKARRKMSPETLRRMREGQQRRWAKVKGESPEAEAKTAKPKRKLSAAGRVAIVAALKKRWAAKKAGETPAKKAKKTA